LDDDAAALRAAGEDIVVTTDAIVEGVHFLPDDPPDTLARKALRVNLSDIAAKGAVPAGFVLTLAVRKVDEAWLKPFARALGEDAADFGCPLLGGDTVSTPGPLMISIT
ncbi:MAG TPA: thiamine-phosphate kinase, partial [Bradyrhizobium sp.]|nr:thiamine-phosphate kinase [Bradyrhizobium sp.]